MECFVLSLTNDDGIVPCTVSQFARHVQIEVEPNHKLCVVLKDLDLMVAGQGSRVPQPHGKVVAARRDDVLGVR